MASPLRGRFFLLAWLCLLAIVTAQPSRAQGPERVYRITWLSLDTQTPLVYEPFRQGLRELGYVQGRNLAFEIVSAEGKLERLDELAAALVRQRADVIVTGVTSTTRAAMKATRSIPIVMLSVPDPVGSKLVKSLARPGGNVTGLAYNSPELSGKQLQVLKELVPSMARLAILRDPRGASGHQATVKEAQAMALALGVQPLVFDAREPREFDAAFAELAKQGAHGILVPAHAIFLRYRKQLAALALKHRLPSMHSAAAHVQAGGLVAYSASLSDNFRRGATVVDKILKGAAPADLPVELPTKFELVLNVGTAKTLGLTIPSAVLVRADKVIR